MWRFGALNLESGIGVRYGYRKDLKVSERESCITQSNSK
jgi:hypothetical protein